MIAVGFSREVMDWAFESYKVTGQLTKRYGVKNSTESSFLEDESPPFRVSLPA
jgi:hypothetical protein